MMAKCPMSFAALTIVLEVSPSRGCQETTGGVRVGGWGLASVRFVDRSQSTVKFRFITCLQRDGNLRPCNRLSPGTSEVFRNFAHSSIWRKRRCSVQVGSVHEEPWRRARHRAASCKERRASTRNHVRLRPPHLREIGAVPLVEIHGHAAESNHAPMH